uniref:NADH-ubiquinone oxidoreductase chain 4L n=1 Tax=Ognevia longipennis TaxID=133961 RepID=D2CW21_9ORTH|nr:NADH dehydrogenase subunit 4L [Ognevia longipennis]ACF71050.1 NADH dehydrogenase subunit 4L [Ognevia longipennis]
MFMISIFTSLLTYFVGVYVFSLKRKHLLMVLLSLKYIVLSLFMLIIIIQCDYDYFFPLYFLIFSVCEGALGLSILVSMIRSHGNGFLNSFSLSLC